eukprot:SAG11_NODE_38500_length_252_cov_0.666667_1_plen_32_part_10
MLARLACSLAPVDVAIVVEEHAGVCREPITAL